MNPVTPMNYSGATVAFGLAAFAVIFVAMAIFWMAVAWRAMRAVEKLADDAKESDAAKAISQRIKP